MEGYERQQQDNENKIFSNSFGGLNTTASPLNVPYEDSPFLLNVITDIQGNVLKRPGTRVIFKSDVAADGVGFISFSTGLNYNFLVAKQGKFIRIYEVFNDTATMVIEKANVFDEAASVVRPFILPTSEVEPRLIFLTGVNKPVQLKFIEQQQTQASASTSVVISNAERFKNAALTQLVVFVNRVRTTPSSRSYNSTTKQLTLVFPTSVAAGSVVDTLLVTWQWWAESITWRGNDLYQTTTRFNVTPTDQNVAIPKALTTDLDQESIAAGRWDISAYRKATNVAGSEYTYNVTYNPATEDEYTQGNGSRYVPGANNYVQPSPYYITFGTIQTAYTGLTPTPAANEPTNVPILRFRRLKFNNGEGALSANVHVYIDSVKKTQSTVYNDATDNIPGNYWLYTDTDDYIGSGGLNIATTIATKIGFTAIYLGVQSSSLVEWVNAERTHVGTAAVASIFDYNDGGYIVASGLGTVADYKNGYYPSSGAIYQGRLVLGGFGHRPLTLVFSGVRDSTLPGQYFADYHITDANTLDTAPFDVVINGKADDRLIAFVEWQSSLFALTRKAVFRLTGGDAPISPAARYVNFISATGCVNHACIAQTDASVVYLSDTGLYDLTPMVENGEYQVRERSLKIRDKFSVTDDPTYEDLAWIAYDSNNRYVVVAYPAVGQFTTTRYIYIYNTFRDSWTEFNTPGGFNTFHGTPYTDRLLGNNFMVGCSTELWQAAGTTQNLIFLRFNDSRYLDYRQTFTHVGGTQYYVTPPAENTFVVTSPQQHFGVTFTATRQSRAFTQHPLVEVADIVVYQTFIATGQTKTLVKDVDWVKEPSGYIYLLQPASVGDTVYVRQFIPSSDFQVGGYSSHQVLVDNFNTTNYTYSVVGTGTSSRYVVTLSGVATNAKVDIGNPYLTAYTTPLFMNQSLGNYKKMKHAYLYFDNRGVLQLFTAADVNAASGQNYQQIVDTYRQKATANVSIMYNSELSGETSADIYGTDELFWDESFMDIAPPFKQHQLFQVFKEPLQGVGYGYQMSVWNYDDGTFKLCGYQIDVSQKGKRYSQR